MKIKILLGFLTLVLTLAIAAVYSIIEFSKISSSVSSILDDNYKTINAANSMLEAAENFDKAILLLQMGKYSEGRGSLKYADSLFRASYSIAKNNITEVHEDEYVTKINDGYLKLRELINHPIAGTPKEGDLSWYHSEFHPLLIEIKTSINDVLELNQTSMHNEAIILKDKSTRAIMPGIVTIIASILFTIMFSFFISYYYLSPLQRIIKKVKEQKNNSQYKTDENAIDELSELDESLRELFSRTRFKQ